MIYRGWGFMTLVTPIAGILLLAYFFPHDGPKGNIPLQQVLLGGALVTGALLANEWLGWRERAGHFQIRQTTTDQGDNT